MAQQAILYGAARAAFPGINQSMLQDGPIFCDIYDQMAAADTAALVLPATGDLGVPPRLVEIYRHTGGDNSSVTSATFVLNNGATLQFQIDPNSKGDSQLRGQLSYTLTLSGLTNGAATAVQIAAAINADATLKNYVYANATNVANTVQLYPVLSNSFLTKTANIPAAQQLAALEGSQYPQFSISGGTAASTLAFASGTFGYPTRTYVSQAKVLAGGTGFSYAYVAATRTLTITNSTGGAVNRVCALVVQ